MNTPTPALSQFERLVQELLARFPSSPLVARTMEPGLSEVLELLQDNPAERPQFARRFIDMLEGRRPSPEWLIAYCMRTLRWPEIEHAAEAVRAAGDPDLLSQAWEVLDAYENEEWAGADLFDRYPGPSSL